MFNYPEAVPLFFDQQYNGDRIEVILQYVRLAKPGERPRIKVDFKISSHRRIAAVRLRITAHDNVVTDVQPRSLRPEPKWEIVTTKAHEKNHQRKLARGVQQMVSLMLKRGGREPDSNSTTESTRSSTATIIGKRMGTFTDNDTAEWNLDEAKTSHGGDGIIGYDEGDGLTFSLLEMPHRFSYDSWVTFVDSDGVERTHHKNSSGFWGKYKFQY
ncbi:hypothetical protein DFH94DRAFT_264683 [Russula ochroleuca]|uniref:Uncharacterized protein n=1 Tax=Russula ochroleuca TaxID=152965 RepID=A0A9P5TD47_9AGAM|nr:hypothetical protein DFH94DRAFT_264683 [Russula ochroleuca]